MSPNSIIQIGTLEIVEDVLARAGDVGAIVWLQTDASAPLSKLQRALLLLAARQGTLRHEITRLKSLAQRRHVEELEERRRSEMKLALAAMLAGRVSLVDGLRTISRNLAITDRVPYVLRLYQVATGLVAEEQWDEAALAEKLKPIEAQRRKILAAAWRFLKRLEGKEPLA